MRAKYPEYMRWQNAMRPEDIAHHDARSGSTAADGESDHFETKVARHFGSLLGVVRNNFAEEEYALWAEYKKHQLNYSRYRAALDSSSGRGILAMVAARAPLERTTAIALVVVLGAAAMGLLSLILSMRGMELWPAVLVACTVGAGLVALSYASGVILRQSQHEWARRACMLAAAATAAVLLSAIGTMPTPLLGVAERLWIGEAAILCCLGIAVCAYFSHDPDPEAARLEREFSIMHACLAELVAKRHENSAFHLNVARRHRELAGQMIAVYRDIYGHSAPAGTSEPRRFDRPPQLIEIDAEWFQLHEENTL